jgi:hypothetical protein
MYKLLIGPILCPPAALMLPEHKIEANHEQQSYDRSGHRSQRHCRPVEAVSPA